MPAKIPPAEKPLADVTVPFGTDAIGIVMADNDLAPELSLRNKISDTRNTCGTVRVYFDCVSRRETKQL